MLFKWIVYNCYTCWIFRRLWVGWETAAVVDGHHPCWSPPWSPPSLFWALTTGCPAPATWSCRYDHGRLRARLGLVVFWMSSFLNCCFLSLYWSPNAFILLWEPKQLVIINSLVCDADQSVRTGGADAAWNGGARSSGGEEERIRGGDQAAEGADEPHGESLQETAGGNSERLQPGQGGASVETFACEHWRLATIHVVVLVLLGETAEQHFL